MCGMKINPDKIYVEMMLEAIRQNEGHCPCQVDVNKDTMCPCKAFREKSECLCGLYVE